MPTYGEVTRWSAQAVAAAGDALKAHVDAVESAADTFATRAVPPADWDGFSAWSARAAHGRIGGALEGYVGTGRRYQSTVYEVEGLVAEIERLVGDVEDHATSNQVSISDDGVVTDRATPPEFEHQSSALDWATSRQRIVNGIVRDLEDILARAATVDATLANAVPVQDSETLDEYGTADPEVAALWSTLSDDERRAVIEEMIAEIAEANGVEVDDVVWDHEDLDGANGFWRDSENLVALNSDLLANPRILHTVAHELRHAQQNEAARDADPNAWDDFWIWTGAADDPFDEHEDNGISRDQATEWGENFDDYVSPPDPEEFEGDPDGYHEAFQEYLDQPVEADAREAGSDYLNDLTVEELERLLEETR